MTKRLNLIFYFDEYFDSFRIFLILLFHRHDYQKFFPIIRDKILKTFEVRDGIIMSNLWLFRIKIAGWLKTNKHVYLLMNWFLNLNNNREAILYQFRICPIYLESGISSIYNSINYVRPVKFDNACENYNMLHKANFIA